MKFYPYRLEYVVETDRLVSTNAAYLSRPMKSKTSGRLTTYTTKTQGLKDHQEFFALVYKKLIPEEIINIWSEFVGTKKYYGLKLLITYHMSKKTYMDRDTSNYLKPYEDSIVNHIKIDDCNNLRLCIEKKCDLSLKDNDWIIETAIEIVPRDSIYVSTLHTYCSQCLKLTESEYNSETHDVSCTVCNRVKYNSIEREKLINGKASELFKASNSVCPVCNGTLVVTKDPNDITIKECLICKVKHSSK